MSSFGPFRLIDRILEADVQSGRLTAECDFAKTGRRELVERYGFPSLLVEVAAQGCGLMTRLQRGGEGDCFLAKVRTFTLHVLPEIPCRVVVTVRRTAEAQALVTYSGEIALCPDELRSSVAAKASLPPLADFQLLMGVVNDLGGETTLRRTYWQAYLDQLGVGNLPTQAITQGISTRIVRR